jgi:hypothetical protein
MMNPEELARALGIRLFRTPFFLPRYPDGEWGKWRIIHTGSGMVDCPECGEDVI